MSARQEEAMLRVGEDELVLLASALSELIRMVGKVASGVCPQVSVYIV
jgi:hypothetical protein